MIEIPHVRAEQLAGTDHQIPLYDFAGGSETSDDVFDYMLTVRTDNLEIAENKEISKDEW